MTELDSSRATDSVPHVSFIALLLCVVVIASAPFLLSGYHLSTATFVGIYALLGLGMSLVIGFAGQFSLASAGFYAIGAYGSAILTAKHGWPALLALLLSATVCAAFALAIGKPLFRLRGHFLAMGTVALTVIIYELVRNLDVTGGAVGFGGVKPFSAGPLRLESLRSQYWLIWGVVVVALWCCLRVGDSREGRALRAIRGHEDAASSCGVDVSWSKARIFAASAFLGSVAGSLYVHVISYVNPEPFAVTTSVTILTLVVLGGLLSPWGALVGAIAIEVIKQISERTVPGLFGSGAVGAGELLLRGLVLVAVLIVWPTGAVGLVQQVWSGFARLIRVRPRNGPATAISHHPEPGKSGMPAADFAQLLEAQGPTGNVLLQCTGLTKHFGGVHAVNGVDLTLHEREILAVIGPNGAGKTTLLNLLSGNLRADAGSIQLLGEDVTGLPAHEIARRGLARTFQTPALFGGMSVRENVLVGAYLGGSVGLVRGSIPTVGARREERRLRARADQTMEELDMAHLADREVGQLSLGEQKLVELGRALANKPAVLLLDEPGAGLQRADKVELMTRLRTLRARGLSLLLIEHDMELVMGIADRVHVLDFGATLRVGTPGEVQADEAVIGAYLGVAADDFDEMEAKR